MLTNYNNMIVRLFCIHNKPCKSAFVTYVYNNIFVVIYKYSRMCHALHTTLWRHLVNKVLFLTTLFYGFCFNNWIWFDILKSIILFQCEWYNPRKSVLNNYLSEHCNRLKQLTLGWTFPLTHKGFYLSSNTAAFAHR